MNNIWDYRTAYKKASRQVSANLRRFTFAGIAVIWVFRVGPRTEASFPPLLRIALLFFVLALFFDFCQYVLQYFIWYHHFAKREAAYFELKGDDEKEAETFAENASHASWKARITHTPFLFKIAWFFVGYIFLITWVVRETFG